MTPTGKRIVTVLSVHSFTSYLAYSFVTIYGILVKLLRIVGECDQNLS